MCRKHDWQYSILQTSILIRFKAYKLKGIHDFYANILFRKSRQYKFIHINIFLLYVQSTIRNTLFDSPSYLYIRILFLHE